MIHLDVIVADTAMLLDASAYGAGALLRWERSTLPLSGYVEGGTVPLVSGDSVYDVWDAAGTVGTWYRTRISNAAGSTFSGYSDPWQTTEQGLYLTLSQVRGFNVGLDLDDESLLILLGSAAQDIVEYAGPTGPIVERLRGSRGPLLYLARTALSITSIVEDTVTLAATDYELSYGGQLLVRFDTGPNPARTWGYANVVTYTPTSDLAQRQRVQLELIKQDVDHRAGLQQQTIGEWSEAYQAEYPGNTYADRRAAILSSLTAGAVLIK